MTKEQVSGLCTLAMFILAIAWANAVAQAQTFSPLYNFNPNSSSDPYGFFNPAALAQGQDGNIYTTSFGGGQEAMGLGRNGAVFSMSPAGGAPSLLFTFYVDGMIGADGANPYSGVTLGTDGNYYGTTPAFGASNNGTVFTITPSGVLATLYSFTGGNDGLGPYAAPVEGLDGNFYGTTPGGGASNCGTIYQVTPGGILTPLYQFDSSTGCHSFQPLVLGTDGNFYGTTEVGGNSDNGVVFKITPTGTFTILYKFDFTHGSQSLSPLVQGSDGNFYGTTTSGGTLRGGVVFKIKPSGKLIVLHNFNPANDGIYPLAGLVQATDNYLYGVTQGGGTQGDGTIFRIAMNGTGYATLYSFDRTTAGQPDIALLQHTSGLFYGLSSDGGTYDSGAFYSFDVGLKPFVSLVSASGAVGSTVGILGQGFTGTKKVLFAGVSAAFTVTSDTYLTAVVPSGAMLGFVTVKTPNGSLKSNKKFHVTP